MRTWARATGQDINNPDTQTYMVIKAQPTIIIVQKLQAQSLTTLSREPRPPYVSRMTIVTAEVPTQEDLWTKPNPKTRTFHKTSTTKM